MSYGIDQTTWTILSSLYETLYGNSFNETYIASKLQSNSISLIHESSNPSINTNFVNAAVNNSSVITLLSTPEVTLIDAKLKSSAKSLSLNLIV